MKVGGLSRSARTVRRCASSAPCTGRRSSLLRTGRESQPYPVEPSSFTTYSKLRRCGLGTQRAHWRKEYPGGRGQLEQRHRHNRRIQPEELAERATQQCADGNRAPHQKTHAGVHPTLNVVRGDRLAQTHLVDVVNGVAHSIEEAGRDENRRDQNRRTTGQRNEQV